MNTWWDNIGYAMNALVQIVHLNKLISTEFNAIEFYLSFEILVPPQAHANAAWERCNTTFAMRSTQCQNKCNLMTFERKSN